MCEVLSILRKFMADEKIDYLLVNSTNKFLVEYNTLAENSRYHLTGFTGSTGDALISAACFSSGSASSASVGR